MVSRLLTAEELETALRHIGATRYHNHHPFHKLQYTGQLTKNQLRAWALNRYYYQSMIPVKDSTILARMEDPALRREWRNRIIDHDGDQDGEGGIARWLRLTQGLGLDKSLVVSTRGILPGVRFAVDAYVNFCRQKSLLESIASSLTELFSPVIIGERTSGMLANYDFITPDTLAYFDKRPTQAKRDSDFALEYVREHATTPEQQRQVIAALEFKTDCLWAQLDALHHAYVEPGHAPPGAWRPPAGA